MPDLSEVLSRILSGVGSVECPEVFPHAKNIVNDKTENIKHKILFIFLSNIIKSPRLLKRL